MNSQPHRSVYLLEIDKFDLGQASVNIFLVVQLTFCLNVADANVIRQQNAHNRGCGVCGEYLATEPHQFLGEVRQSSRMIHVKMSNATVSHQCVKCNHTTNRRAHEMKTTSISAGSISSKYGRDAGPLSPGCTPQSNCGPTQRPNKRSSRATTGKGNYHDRFPLESKDTTRTSHFVSCT
jgi:hypothetical protein